MLDGKLHMACHSLGSAEPRQPSRAEYSPLRFPSTMNTQIAAYTALAATLLLACSPAYYNLDDGVLLFGASPALEHAETAIVRLGGRTGHAPPVVARGLSVSI